MIFSTLQIGRDGSVSWKKYQVVQFRDHFGRPVGNVYLDFSCLIWTRRQVRESNLKRFHRSKLNFIAYSLLMKYSKVFIRVLSIKT